MNKNLWSADGSNESIVSQEAGTDGPFFWKIVEVEEESSSMVVAIQMEMAKTMETLRANQTQ